MSNRPFAEKRVHLRNSKFATSRAIGRLERWDGPALEERSRSLIAASLARWPLPDGVIGTG